MPSKLECIIKQACIFHLILLGIPSNLILYVKNRECVCVCVCVWGGGGGGQQRGDTYETKSVNCDIKVVC